MRSLQSAAKQEIECGEEMQFGGGGRGELAPYVLRVLGTFFFMPDFRVLQEIKLTTAAVTLYLVSKMRGRDKKNPINQE